MDSPVEVLSDRLTGQFVKSRVFHALLERLCVAWMLFGFMQTRSGRRRLCSEAYRGGRSASWLGSRHFDTSNERTHECTTQYCRTVYSASFTASRQDILAFLLLGVRLFEQSSEKRLPDTMKSTPDVHASMSFCMHGLSVQCRHRLHSESCQAGSGQSIDARFSYCLTQMQNNMARPLFELLKDPISAS